MGERFSTEYVIFKQTDSSLVREKGKEPGFVPISERLVSCLWYSQKYLKALATVGGNKVQVISPGIWNLESGPDFIQAALKIDDEIIKGDIEIHTYSSDWTAHLHHKKPQFNNVVAHVAMWNDKGTSFLTTASGKRIPQIELSKFLTRPLKKIVDQVESDDFPYRKDAGTGRCSELISSISKQELTHLLQIAGEWRILEKSLRYKEWLKNADFDEVLYKAVMEAMGYYNNKEPFLTLAERIPYEILSKTITSKLATSSHYTVQSILLNLSGLFPDGENLNWDDETLKFYHFIRNLWLDFQKQSSYFPMDAAKWDLRARPPNSPTRRIAGISLWIYKNKNQPVLKTLLRIFNDLADKNARFQDDFDRFKQNLFTRSRSREENRIKDEFSTAIQRLHHLFTTGEDKYWSYHYTLGGRKLQKPVSLIGEKRVEEIIINVLIPILLLYFRQTRAEQENILYLVFNFLPKSSENKITRLMKHRLFGKTQKFSLRETAATQQGLHQIFKDYCSKDKGGCLDCFFQQNLQKWIDSKTAP